MLSSVRSSNVRPNKSTYLSTLRFLSVSWAELKLDTTRVAIPKHLRTEEQEVGGAGGSDRPQVQGEDSGVQVQESTGLTFGHSLSPDSVYFASSDTLQSKLRNNTFPAHFLRGYTNANPS